MLSTRSHQSVSIEWYRESNSSGKSSISWRRNTLFASTTLLRACVSSTVRIEGGGTGMHVYVTQLYSTGRHREIVP